jgi:hypothetical protein
VTAELALEAADGRGRRLRTVAGRRRLHHGVADDQQGAHPVLAGGVVPVHHAVPRGERPVVPVVERIERLAHMADVEELADGHGTAGARSVASGTADTL